MNNFNVGDVVKVKSLNKIGKLVGIESDGTYLVCINNNMIHASDDELTKLVNTFSSYVKRSFGFWDGVGHVVGAPGRYLSNLYRNSKSERRNKVKDRIRTYDKSANEISDRVNAINDRINTLKNQIRKLELEGSNDSKKLAELEGEIRRNEEKIKSMDSTANTIKYLGNTAGVLGAGALLGYGGYKLYKKLKNKFNKGEEDSYDNESIDSDYHNYL